MTIHDWSTGFPAALDTATQLPDVASGDATRVSQLNTVADILMALEAAEFARREPRPVLSYNTAAALNVIAAPGGAATLRAVLNDGKARTATAPLVIDLTVSGEGGLDTGTEAVSTWYYCYLIPKAADDSLLMAICSITPPTTGPTGKSVWKYLGAVRNNASGNLLKWYQVPGGLFRLAYYINKSIGAGEDANPVSMSLGSEIPITAQAASVSFYVQSTSSGLLILWADGDGHATERGVQAWISDSGADSNSAFMPTLTSPKVIYYKRVGASISGASIYVNGWIDGFLV